MSCLWCIISFKKIFNDDENEEVERIIKKVEKKKKMKKMKDKYEVINGEIFEEISL